MSVVPVSPPNSVSHEATKDEKTVKKETVAGTDWKSPSPVVESRGIETSSGTHTLSDVTVLKPPPAEVFNVGVGVVPRRIQPGWRKC